MTLMDSLEAAGMCSLGQSPAAVAWRLIHRSQIASTRLDWPKVSAHAQQINDLSLFEVRPSRIAGFGLNDKIDISKFGAVLLSDSEHINGQDSTATIKFTSGFELNLSFQGAVTDDDLRFALGATLFT